MDINDHDFSESTAHTEQLLPSAQELMENTGIHAYNKMKEEQLIVP